MNSSETKLPILQFGFVSYQDRTFELIAQNEQGDEITLRGHLTENQTIEDIDKVFPSCVFVRYAITKQS